MAELLRSFDFEMLAPETVRPGLTTCPWRKSGRGCTSGARQETYSATWRPVRGPPPSQKIRSPVR